jgi:hypothetical protein
MNALRTTVEDSLSGVLGWKLLKLFLSSPECANEDGTLYLLNCPTDEGSKELSHGNVQ